MGRSRKGRFGGQHESQSKQRSNARDRRNEQMNKQYEELFSLNSVSVKGLPDVELDDEDVFYIKYQLDDYYTDCESFQEEEEDDDEEDFNEYTGSDLDLDETAVDYLDNIAGDESLVADQSSNRKIVVDYRPNNFNDQLDEEAMDHLRKLKEQSPELAEKSWQELESLLSNTLFFQEIDQRRMGARPIHHRQSKTSEKRREHSDRLQSKSHTPAINLRQIYRDIKVFITDDSQSELDFDPQPILVRKAIHDIAALHKLKSKSFGSGLNRHCRLSKDTNCSHKSAQVNHKKLDKLLTRYQNAISYESDPKTASGKKNKKKKKGKNDSDRSEFTGLTRPQVGEVIGSKAAPIAEDNVGNQLLQKMGWKPGNALGSSSGQSPLSNRTSSSVRIGAGNVDDDATGNSKSSSDYLNPISAVYRRNRTGLGA